MAVKPSTQRGHQPNFRPTVCLPVSLLGNQRREALYMRTDSADPSTAASLQSFRRSNKTPAGSAGFLACGFTELSSSVTFSAGINWGLEVPKTRRQECLRYFGALRLLPAPAHCRTWLALPSAVPGPFQSRNPRAPPSPGGDSGRAQRLLLGEIVAARSAWRRACQTLQLAIGCSVFPQSAFRILHSSLPP